MRKRSFITTGKKVLASAVSAAMVVAFTPVVAWGALGEGETAVAGVDIDNDGIVDEQFSSLESAISDAQTGSTVRLMDDVSISNDETSARIWIKKTLTIDFNDHSIYMDTGSSINNWAAFYIGGTGTVVTLQGNGGITNRSDSYCLHIADQDAKLLIRGGNYVGATTAVNLQKGEVTITGGSFEVTPYKDSYRYLFE